jgi:fructose-bisphosphate aldolase class II
MLVTNRDMMVPARKKGYAIGAFNVQNLESMSAIAEAAVEEKSPTIMQITPSVIKYAGLAYISNLVKTAAQLAPVPIAMHLDHGDSFDTALKCINAGFTSVMIDGSFLSVEEKDAILTDPKAAVEFVEKTGVDTLAVAIGTSHGAYKFKSEAKLDLKRLAIISEKIGIPLVLHGASSVPQDIVKKANKYGAELTGAKGIPEDQYRKAIPLGIAKINIDTDLRLAFTATVREVLTNSPKNFDPRKILGPAKNAMKEVAKGKMRLFGSSGKA